MPELIFPRQRYQCIQCGKSCGHWRIWVEPDLVAPLREHPLALRLEVAGQNYLLEEADGWHRLGYDAQGRCFFLEDDRRCGLHSSTGWLSKPRACRQFPLFLAETPDGIQVGLSFRCSAVQQDQGLDWAAHEADLHSLVASGSYPRLGFEPVSWGRSQLPWEVYLGWERRWRDLLAQGHTVERVFHQHLCQELQLALSLREFAEMVERWTFSALQLLRTEAPASLPPAVSSPESVRFFDHILERKALWSGSDFLGRMLLVAVGERLLATVLGRGGNWSNAFDRVEGEWLGHREDLGPVEQGLAQHLLQFCSP